MASPLTHLAHAQRVRELLAPAFARLRADTAGGEPEWLAIDDPGLPGRVTARAVITETELPPFDNSQMDGYVVRTADFVDGPPYQFPVGRATAAGDAPTAHEPGTAAPIMTGAAMPAGADAVIPIEQADPPRFTSLRRAGEPEVAPARVAFGHAPETGAFVRRAGSDHPARAPLLAAGARLRPSSIGLLASAGVARVAVRARPRILLVSTGDEVVAPGRPLTPGRIYDANAPLLSAALREAGAVVTAVHVADDPAAFLGLLAEAAPTHDLLVTSGGISQGAFEVVRETLTAGWPAAAPAVLQASTVEFGGIAMQPGGPQGVGTVTIAGAERATSLPVLCFPGNPVSSAISAELFLLPLLRDHAGVPEPARETRVLAHDTDSPAHKHQVRRGAVDEAGAVVLTPPSSHLLADLARAELLAHIPVGVDHLAAGSPIEIQRFHV